MKAWSGLVAAACSIVLAGHADACTRALCVGESGTVITGRTMDWLEDMGTNLWVLPAGIARDGEAGSNSPYWTAK